MVVVAAFAVMANDVTTACIPFIFCLAIPRFFRNIEPLAHPLVPNPHVITRVDAILRTLVEVVSKIRAGFTPNTNGGLPLLGLG